MTFFWSNQNGNGKGCGILGDDWKDKDVCEILNMQYHVLW